MPITSQVTNASRKVSCCLQRDEKYKMWESVVPAFLWCHSLKSAQNVHTVISILGFSIASVNGHHCEMETKIVLLYIADYPYFWSANYNLQPKYFDNLNPFYFLLFLGERITHNHFPKLLCNNSCWVFGFHLLMNLFTPLSGSYPNHKRSGPPFTHNFLW